MNEWARWATVVGLSEILFVCTLGTTLPARGQPFQSDASPGIQASSDDVRLAGTTWLTGAAPARTDSIDAGDDLELSFTRARLARTDWIMARAKEVRTEAPDPDEVPVVILHYSASYLCGEPGGCLVRQRNIVLINSIGAADAYRTYEIPFDTLSGRPEILAARVIRRDGSVRPISPDEAVVVASEDPTDQVHDRKELVIPMSKVEVGAVVDVAWQSRRQERLGDGFSGRTFLRFYTPTRESVTEIRVPRNQRLVLYQSESAPPPIARSSATHTLYRWTLPVGEAIPYQANAGTAFDVFPWVGYSSHSSWATAYVRLHDHYRSNTRPSQEINDLARRLTRGCGSDAARLEAIFNYVSEEIDYLAIEFGDGNEVPTPAPEVLARGYGDCKDKVALLVSLLGCVGIEAHPVLVVGRDEASVIPELIETGRFTHVVAYVPGLNGGVYCDPTPESGCFGQLASDYQGTFALALPAAGDGRLLRIPEPLAEHHGFRMEFDVHPQSDGSARIEVEGVFHGDLASYPRWAHASGDSSSRRWVVDHLLGYGLAFTGATLKDWTLSGDRCEPMTMSATYRDTTWGPGIHSKAFAIRHALADPTVDFLRPDSSRRRFVVGHPYRDTVVIRLHPGGGWVPDGDITTLDLSGSFYFATIDAKRVGGSPDAPIEITEVFENRRSVMSAEEYRAFHHDWLRIFVGICQPLRYHRTLSDEPMASGTGVASPDFGTTMEQVVELLGDDSGGEGPFGRARREQARQLLNPLLAMPDGGTWPLVMMALIEVGDGRTRAADSLLRRALSIDRTNMMATMLSMATREAIGDREGLRQLLYQASRQFPVQEVRTALILYLHRDGLHEEAAREEERLLARGAREDSTAVMAARCVGCVYGEQSEEARAACEQLRTRVPPLAFAKIEASVLVVEDRLNEAADSLEVLWAAAPLDPALCNELAWVRTLLGEDLDLAEELARSASKWTWGEPAIHNTLGAVLARTGRWQDARAVFHDILERDDTLENQIVNAYFVALCDYQLGETDDAIRGWEEALGRALPGRWKKLITESLERARNEQPVAGLLFKGEVL